MSIGKGTKEGKDLEARAERITGLEGQVKALAVQAKEIKAQIAEEYEDAAGAGYNKSVLRQVIKELAMDADQRQGVFDFESEVDVYRHALGIEPAAAMIVGEMTETERLKTRVFGADSDEGKEAIEAARGRVNKKARDKHEAKQRAQSKKKPPPDDDDPVARAERTSLDRAKRNSQAPLAGSIIQAAVKHGVETGKLTDNGDGTYDMPTGKDGVKATLQVVR